MGTFLQKYFDLTKINTSFSFAPFYQFLQKRTENEDDVKRKMLQYFATRIEEAGVQEKDISADELPQYKELLDILYVSLTNIMIDGSKDIWGLQLHSHLRLLMARLYYISFLLIKKQAG
ncbi:hypothetical protein [Niabella ginsengisoli]|uniref:Uncharacterized protein n=1 Tax=Niabella ginsengisoli TaxID=522298 RepID=A0ABS9SGP5_9BACT|nr:hypothetical protein [Niabella ginsengisoli]MCH5597537.1 hypothetical protein [Niabella ginsengisoli]